MAEGGRGRFGRREFILLSLGVGVAALASPWALPRVLRRLGIAQGPYRGRLLDVIEALTGRLERRELSPEQFLAEIDRRYGDFDLQAELAPWLEAPAGDEGERLLFEGRLASRQQVLRLVFMPPGHAAPPHAHHDLLSAQTVLAGELHVRQYERVQRLDPHTLALRASSDRSFQRHETILTTEFQDNVHWFGPERETALVLQYNLAGGLETFEKGRPMGRYFVDPMAAPTADGLIRAPEIDVAAALERFARRRLSEFRSPLRA